jgi:DUF917 family protein
MKDDEYSLPIAMIGAPSCIIEKLLNFKKFENSAEPILKISNKKVTFALSLEIGGVNSLTPLIYSALTGVLTLDLDLMGRAFPTIDLTSLSIYDQQQHPMALADDHGNKILLYETCNNSMKLYENYLRSLLVNMNLSGAISFNPQSKEVLDKYSVKYTLGRCWRLGRSIIYSRINRLDLSKTLFDLEGSKEIYKGKISDVKNEEWIQ